MAKLAQVSAQPRTRMLTVVINLERDKACLAAVSAEFGRHGMTFERFAAVEVRLLRRDRFQRYRHNVRTVGVWRAAAAEFRNLFRGRTDHAEGAHAAQEPIRSRKEAFEV